VRFQAGERRSSPNSAVILNRGRASRPPLAHPPRPVVERRGASFFSSTASPSTAFGRARADRSAPVEFSSSA
jgi:hypothetical protein